MSSKKVNSRLLHQMAILTASFLPTPSGIWFYPVEFIEEVMKIGKQVSTDRSFYGDGGTIHVMLKDKILAYDVYPDSVHFYIVDEEG